MNSKEAAPLDFLAGLRVVLDTNVVRRHLHRDSDRLDLERARAVAGTPVRFSLSAVCVAELVEQLLAGQVGWALWRDRICELDSIIDQEHPLLGGGHYRAVRLGYPPTSADFLEIVEAQDRATWSLLRIARTSADLRRGRWVRMPGCKPARMAYRENSLAPAKAIRSRWSNLLETVKDVEGPISSHKLEEIYDDVTADRQALEQEFPGFVELTEGLRRLMVYFVILTINGYKPEKHRGGRAAQPPDARNPGHLRVIEGLVAGGVAQGVDDPLASDAGGQFENLAHVIGARPALVPVQTSGEALGGRTERGKLGARGLPASPICRNAAACSASV